MSAPRSKPSLLALAQPRPLLVQVCGAAEKSPGRSLPGGRQCQLIQSDLYVMHLALPAYETSTSLQHLCATVALVLTAVTSADRAAGAGSTSLDRTRGIDELFEWGINLADKCEQSGASAVGSIER